MKLPIPVERLLQAICGIAILWSVFFMYRAYSHPLPDTKFSKIESVWEVEKESESLLSLLRENLEKLRQPLPLATNDQIKALRNVFSPDEAPPPPPSVFCETCGGENLGNALVCKHCGSLLAPDPKIDTDNDGMPDYWEIQYSLDPKDPGDAHEDPDNDGADNLSEFLKGTNPRDDRPDPNPVPESPLPFSLVKTYQKPIQILFMGYILLKDGRYEMQVNWAGKTEFYKVGDEIRGYSILDFKKMIETVPNPKTGVPTFEDVSSIVCQRKQQPAKTFVKGKLVTDNDVFAKVRFSDSLEEKEVYIDAGIEDHVQGRTYKVTDILLRPPKIIVVDETKKKYTLQTQKGTADSNSGGSKEE